ncbi:cytochrome P450 [Paenibacillus sp. ClWae2A]|uniref:cytochrome P450 n=1 Tax=Paenibacillus sp. ClWae2A TaxID=3057177 RepID=UPI0028F6AFA5|nr:cytochrome P450 [Paenibacillus sp. ClWae2A]MDT9717824.1 cytochrome P450 [Paenibacillus sp. ClWae2A]
MRADNRSIVIHKVSNLETPEELWNPYAYYEDMLENHPIFFDEKQQVWNLYRYDDVNSVLTDWKRFSSVRKRSVSPVPPVVTRVDINSVDPPVQRDIRKLVSSAFTPRQLKTWEPQIAAIVDELMLEMKAKDDVDIVRDLGVPLPVTVIADLLGVERQHRAQIKAWSDKLFFPNAAGNEQEQINEKYAAMQEFNEFLLPIVQQKRKHPAEDIISDLTLAELDGDQLTDEEVVTFSLGLLAAGNETTTNMINSLFYSFMYDQPGIYQDIAANPELIENTVEESLRYRFPTTLDRVLTEDTDILGVPMKKGDVVLTWLGAANNDPRHFPEPSRFDIYRPNSNRHLAFGKGPHFCLGAPLARLEGQLVLRGFTSHFSDITAKIKFEAASQLYPGTQTLQNLPAILTPKIF